MNHRLMFAAPLALLLCACVTAAEQTEQIAAAQAAAQAAAEAADDTQCRSYGSKPGTEQYFQCRLTLNQNRVNAEAAAEANKQAAFRQIIGTSAYLWGVR